jgi:3-oxoadipate enol-lactonase
LNERQDISATRRLRAGDVDVTFAERGSGMPVVLLHGFPLDHSMWDAQLNQLSRRWRPIAPDLRGFGGSRSTSDTASMAQMAEDVHALLEALDIQEPVAVCGLSMGGYVALQFWCKYPRQVRALILCNTRSTADTHEAAATRRKMAEHVLRAGTDYVAEAMLPKLFAPETFASKPDVVEFERQKILSASPRAIAAAIEGLASRPDVSEHLAQISVPTLVVAGQHDAITSESEMRRMAAAIAGAEFVVIPNAGHMTPLENPAAFNDAVERFLERSERERV